MPSPGAPAALDFSVDAAEAGGRLDQLVARRAGVSRREARLWIRAGRVSVGGRVVRILTRPLRQGAQVRVEPQGVGGDPERDVAGKISILGRGPGYVVIDKPARLLSEGDRLASPSVESVLARLLAEHGRAPQVHLVHRLDAGTSGVMVVALRASAARELGRQFHDGVVRKVYWALCAGVLKDACWIDLPIGRARGTRHAVQAGGRPASTRVEPLCHGRGVTLVRAMPTTGRTHQIRVHLSHLGLPLLGDRLYGGPGYTDATPAEPIERVMLHAYSLALTLPGAGQVRCFEVAPPQDFVRVARHYGAWSTT